jgi:hypothetical protein
MVKQNDRGKCRLNCSEGMDYCCICCPKKEECRMQCDTLDSYELAENCPYYVKEK